MKMWFCYYDELDTNSQGHCNFRKVDLGEHRSVKAATLHVNRLIAEAREGFQPHFYPGLDGVCNVVGTINNGMGVRLAILKVSSHCYRWCVDHTTVRP